MKEDKTGSTEQMLDGLSALKDSAPKLRLDDYGELLEEFRDLEAKLASLQEEPTLRDKVALIVFPIFLEHVYDNADPEDWERLPNAVWSLTDELMVARDHEENRGSPEMRITPWFVCEFCFTKVLGSLPDGWDLVYQSAVCVPCQERVELDGGYGVVCGGAYAGDTPDPRTGGGGA